ncbi:uncharacterized protein LOC142589006 [Dermacentor variabilis]|uniref:uncharacterized protein LOC142589006 n=1 Tax=Dermacentor variabilis TaxID=34621 RepID=UPI003F5C0907
MACVLKIGMAAFALLAAAKLCNASEGGSEATSTNVFKEFWQGNDGVWTLKYTDTIVTTCKWQKATEIFQTNVKINTSYITGINPVNTEYTWHFFGNESMSRQAGIENIHREDAHLLYADPNKICAVVMYVQFWNHGENVTTDGLRCRLQPNSTYLCLGRTFHELFLTAENIEKEVPENCLQKYNEEIAKIPREKAALKTGYTKELCKKSEDGPSSTPARTA